ncbi:MAG TPA: hypothetical protein VMU33_10450 [Burkholderiaceae bacterium]|nr:hypothetical protein [Burkholderiaceae bacterium]
MRRPDGWPGRAAAAWLLQVDDRRLELRAADGRVVERDDVDGSAAIGPAAGRMLAAHPDGEVQVRVDAGVARLFLVPWADALTSGARWHTYACSRFEQAYGESADEWTVRVVDELPPRARLAVALPTAWLKAVTLGGARRVVSVRVGLLDRVARLLASEPRFSGCAIEVGASVATLLVFVQGELRRVRARRFDAAEELAATVRSEWASFGIAASAVGAAVALPAAARAALGDTLAAALGATRVVELEPLSP